MIKVQPSKNIKDGIAKLIAASIEDYNKFCIINKNNANRRALSMFFVNLMKHGIVSKGTFLILKFGRGPMVAYSVGIPLHSTV